MRAVLQRVRSASVSVDGDVVARIGRGYLVLVGVGKGDGDAEVDWMARKLTSVRVFGDEDGRMSKGLADVHGELLLVSQFTLYGDVRKGTRPSFDQSAEPKLAKALYDKLVERALELMPGRVHSGVFQAMMKVSLENDGPVTLVIETREEKS